MRLIPVLLAATLLAAPCNAQAANHVRIDRFSYIAPGTTNLTIGIYFTNDVPISALVVPLELRTCSGNAYMAGPNFTIGFNPAGRLYSSPLGPVADPAGRWPASSVFERIFPAPSPNPPYPAFHCTRPADSGGYWSTSAMLPDFISPDALLFVSVASGDPRIGEEWNAAPGADAAHAPSYRITCNVSLDTGVFVIDTTCLTPHNNLSYIQESQEVILLPMFEAGYVGVGTNYFDCLPGECSCSDHSGAEITANMVTVLDVVAVIDVAFRGVAATRLLTCPVDVTDCDCTGSTDIVDVVRTIEVAFRHADPAAKFCDPCAGG